MAAKAHQGERERQAQAAYDRAQATMTSARAQQAAQVEAARRQEAGRLSQELQKQARDGRPLHWLCRLLWEKGMRASARCTLLLP